MKQTRILLSFLFLLFFIACGGGGDSGSSSSPTTGDGSGGGGGIEDDNPVSGPGDTIPIDNVGPGDDADNPELDPTVVNPGGGTTQPQACVPLESSDLLSPYRSYTTNSANSAVISFASVGSTFTIVNSELTLSNYQPSSLMPSRGKLDYWNFDNRVISQNIWTPPSSLYISFKDLAYCFNNMTVGTATNQIVCAMKANFATSDNNHRDRFVLFKIDQTLASSPTATFLGAITYMREFSVPIIKLSNTHIAGADTRNNISGTLTTTYIHAVDVSSLPATNPFISAPTLKTREGNYMTIPHSIISGAPSYDLVKSVSFMRGSTLSVVSLYKRLEGNYYILKLIDTNDNEILSSPFSTTITADQLIVNYEDTNRIYVLGENLKEISVFNFTFTSPRTITSRKTFLVSPQDTTSLRSTSKAISIDRKYISTLGKNAAGQNAVFVIDTDRETEAAILDNYFTISNADYTNSSYDIKKFRYGTTSPTSGIVLKKSNELNLYRYNASLCR